MHIHTLKRLAFLLPVLFIGRILFGFTLLNPAISLVTIFPVFVILAGGAIGFTFWAFELIERREGEARIRSDQLATLHEAALALTEELDLRTLLQRVVDQARTLARAKYGALGGTG